MFLSIFIYMNECTASTVFCCDNKQSYIFPIKDRKVLSVTSRTLSQSLVGLTRHSSYEKNNKKNPNSSLFSDNCLISLSRPRPDRRLSFWIPDRSTTTLKARLDGSAGVLIVLRDAGLPLKLRSLPGLWTDFIPRGDVLLATVPSLRAQRFLASCSTKCHNAACAYRSVLTLNDYFTITTLDMDYGLIDLWVSACPVCQLLWWLGE